MADYKLRCIAIDDEPPALKLLKEYVSRIPAIEMVEVFDDAVSGAEFLRHTTVDILFIDINMPDISGIDLVKSLTIKPLIIFTTAYKKFAFEGFELEAVDYLLKPISFPRFSKAIQKAISLHHKTSPLKPPDTQYLYVRSEYRMLKIDIDSIEYIEGLEDYIRIHMSDVKPVMTLMTLKAVLDKLPPGKFKRIHRSYIVSVDKVISIHHKKATLVSARQLPISETYLDFLNEWKQNSL